MCILSFRLLFPKITTMIIVSLLRILMLALFAIVVFFREKFPNDTVYWLTYVFMLFLVYIYWLAAFWVSKRKAVKMIGKEPDYAIFCGKVPQKVEDDLERGQLCIYDGKMTLVHNNGGKYSLLLEIPVKEITKIGFGVVVGKRKGFTVYYSDNKEVSFACSKIFKQKDMLYKAIGWDLNKEN